MSDSDDDEPEEVGYRRPPKNGQFKKGQSGCPGGGHAKRRANKEAKAKKEAKVERKKLRDLRNLIKTIALELHNVQTSNGTIELSAAEILLRRAVQKGLDKNASDKDMRRAIALFDRAGIYDPEPERGRTGVLVVYPPRTEEEWEKATEGELLPRDPLHGIPGAEGLLVPDAKRPARPPPPE